METTRWTNPTLPQTLQSAVILLYMKAAITLLFGGLFVGGGYGLLLIAGYVAGGFGIANERRWGYNVALAAAFLPFVIGYLFVGWRGVFPTTFSGLLSIAFDILLVVLLLHPQSREYQRIWFN
jgi:hypothetical protein